METPEQAIKLVMNCVKLTSNINEIVIDKLDLTDLTDDQVEDLGWNIARSEVKLTFARYKLLVEKDNRIRSRDIDELDR